MKHIERINEAVGMKNNSKMNGGGKWMVCPFIMQELCKYIGCILESVIYSKKGHKLSSEVPKYFGRTAHTKLQRDVHGNDNLYKVCCDNCCPYYIYACY